MIKTLIYFECFEDDEHINLIRYYSLMNSSFSVILETFYFYFFLFAT